MQRTMVTRTRIRVYSYTVINMSTANCKTTNSIFFHTAHHLLSLLLPTVLFTSFACIQQDAVLPPAKRTKVVESEPGCFLVSFPKEILNNVLLFFSRLPNAKDWENHIDVRDLVELSAVRGELGTYIKTRFNALVVSPTKDCYDENEYRGWAVPGPYLWTDNFYTAIAYVLAGGGANLRTLAIGIGVDYYDPRGYIPREVLDRRILPGRGEALRKLVFPKGRETMNEIDMHLVPVDLCHEDTDVDTDWLIDYVFKHCPNIKSLSLDHTSSPWMKFIGSKLEKLYFTFRYQLDFTSNCTNLRELTLDTEDAHIKYTDLWWRIGSSLETLKITARNLAKEEIDEIRKRCRNLKKISLAGDTAALVSFLASYGEYAWLYRMIEGQVRDVAGACPNATSLKEIGHKLEPITMHWRWFEIDDDSVDWKDAWGKCINLRELDIGLRSTSGALRTELP